MAGHQVFLAAVTVSELRYGALVAEWGQARRRALACCLQQLRGQLIRRLGELKVLHRRPTGGLPGRKTIR